MRCSDFYYSWCWWVCSKIRLKGTPEFPRQVFIPNLFRKKCWDMASREQCFVHSSWSVFQCQLVEEWSSGGSSVTKICSNTFCLFFSEPHLGYICSSVLSHTVKITSFSISVSVPSPDSFISTRILPFSGAALLQILLLWVSQPKFPSASLLHHHQLIDSGGPVHIAYLHLGFSVISQDPFTSIFMLFTF